MNEKNSKFFYGYIVVAAAFWVMTLGWGSNRTFGVFLEPMLREFGWTRGAISASFTLNMLVMGILALIAGRLTDRIGPRSVMAVCGVFLGLSYICASLVQTIWHFHLFFGIIGGIGMSGILTPSMSVVVRWFWKRRSLMSGILVAGPALGIAILPFLFSLIISSFGWRFSFLILGIAVLSGILLATLFIRGKPEDLGLLPLGAGESFEQAQKSALRGLSFQEALRTHQFWLLNLLSFCDLFLINVIVVHIVIHAIDMHIPADRAASVLSLAAGVSIPGRILMGGFADRVGNRPALLICLSMSVAAFLLLIMAKGLPMLYAFAVLYGLGLYASGAIVSPLIAEYFGLRSHATLYSCSVFTSSIGSASGPVIAGSLFDSTGSYNLTFLVCLVISLVAMAAILLLRPLPQKDED